jgi:hypothetical protein
MILSREQENYWLRKVSGSPRAPRAPPKSVITSELPDRTKTCGIDHCYVGAKVLSNVSCHSSLNARFLGGNETQWKLFNHPSSVTFSSWLKRRVLNFVIPTNFIFYLIPTVSLEHTVNRGSMPRLPSFEQGANVTNQCNNTAIMKVDDIEKSERKDLADSKRKHIRCREISQNLNAVVWKSELLGLKKPIEQIQTVTPQENN